MSSPRERIWTLPNGEQRKAYVVDYRDQTGKRRSRQFRLKKQAEKFQTKALYEVSIGIHTVDRESITVAEAGKLWIDHAKSEGLERSTVKRYGEILRLHIVPFLGGRRLSALSPHEVEQFRDDLLATRSKAMAHKTVRALSMLINEAGRRNLVARNVASKVRVKRPSRERERVAIPSRAELKAMLEASTLDERPLLMVLMATGIRASELRGLPWRDIDLRRARLNVTQRADQWGAIGQPKSAAGTRTIPMPPELVAELRTWKLRALPNDLDLVFPSSVGTPRDHAHLLERIFKPLQVRAGVCSAVEPTKLDNDGRPLMKARYGLHALRHAAASGWISGGADIKRLQAWLGHETVQMTLGTYGHLLVDEERDDALALAASRGLFS